MSVSVSDLVNKIKLQVVQASDEALERDVTTADISRPGLEMSGYFDYYTPERIQLFGMKEWSYMMKYTSDNRYDRLKQIITPETPAVIVARGLEIPSEMYAAAKKQDVALLQSNEVTSRLSANLTTYLIEALAERHTVHGVHMDIFGTGVLIQGASGVGKSETGLELVKRGHRLIADDRVDVYRKNEFTLMGQPADVLKHLMEIRGVGIIDVMMLFGAGAVKDYGEINLAVNLVPYEKGYQYDRLGNGTKSIELAEVKVPQIEIPVQTGRNISVIIEAAVMNFHAKNMGYDATENFVKNLNTLIKENS
ncbi:HPr(Ser) kinase/phosphatase [Floricoccus penangensis]|uniref:HPr(Ser) kinase/phosphatase n=1 Tax=Floricoccus penangensis TaxID=1859475 RepID=UPI00203ED66E|nr:HPr(Ser) kinase/phosphatase [Floricoccus penangensis]URZ87191.1 HPr kinase/phosphorylase [Floricoccus penangensis]